MLTQQVLGTSTVQQGLLYKTGANSTVQALTTGLLGGGQSSSVTGSASQHQAYSVELTGGVAGYLGRSQVKEGSSDVTAAQGNSYIQVLEGNSETYTSNWASNQEAGNLDSIFSSFFSNYGSTLGVSESMAELYGNNGVPNGFGQLGLNIPTSWTSEDSLGHSVPSLYSDNQAFGAASIPEMYTTGNTGASIPEMYTTGNTGASIPEMYTTGNTGASIPEMYTTGNIGASIPNMYMTGDTGASIPNMYTTGDTGASIPNMYMTGDTGASIPNMYATGDMGAAIPDSYITGNTGAVLPDMFLNGGDISANIESIFSSVVNGQTSGVFEATRGTDSSANIENIFTSVVDGQTIGVSGLLRGTDSGAFLC